MMVKSHLNDHDSVKCDKLQNEHELSLWIRKKKCTGLVRLMMEMQLNALVM